MNVSQKLTRKRKNDIIFSMVDRVFDTYSDSYPELVEVTSKLFKTIINSENYCLNKYYKEHALKTEGEYYHG